MIIQWEIRYQSQDLGSELESEIKVHGSGSKQDDGRIANPDAVIELDPVIDGVLLMWNYGFGFGQGNCSV
jgi:hypothetical protein